MVISPKEPVLAAGRDRASREAIPIPTRRKVYLQQRAAFQLFASPSCGIPARTLGPDATSWGNGRRRGRPPGCGRHRLGSARARPRPAAVGGDRGTVGQRDGPVLAIRSLNPKFLDDTADLPESATDLIN